MATLREIITGALRLVNVVQQNEEPTAADVNITLEALNALIDSKSNEILNIHTITPYRYSLVPGQFQYSLGPEFDNEGNATNADWVTERYMRMEQAKLMLNPIIRQTPRPAIFNFSPLETYAGSTIIIDGYGLAEATKVTFNDVEAVILSVTDTQLQVELPVGGGGGLIAITLPSGIITSANLPVTGVTEQPVPFVYDTFTAANGTRITDHISDNGVTWTEGSGETYMIASNSVMGIQRTSSETYILPSAGVTGEWYLELDLDVGNLDATISSTLQVVQDSNDGFMFYIDNNWTAIIPTAQVPLAEILTQNSTNTLRFEYRSEGVSLYINGDFIASDDSVGFLPSGLIRLEIFAGFPASASEPVIMPPYNDQEYSENYGYHISKVVMAPL